MTPGAARYPRLFSPLDLGPLRLPNRMVMAAMDPSLADAEGRVTPAMVRHYRDRAAGGAGLIITGNVAVSPRGRLSPWMAMLADDAALEGFRGLCDAIHGVGGRIFIQLSHAGRQTVSQFCGGQPLSASDLPCPVMRDPPRAMTEAEIDETLEAFAQAAGRAKAAGADGIEIHMAHGYLVCQFLSPYSNVRDDRWGGTPEGRVRFATALLARVRACVGPDFPVQCRISADERVAGGIEPALAAIYAEALVRAGATSLSVSACNYESYRYNMPAYYLPEATYASLAGGVRRHLAAAGLSVPVVAVGRFRRPEICEATLAAEDADLVALGRALIADPDLPRHLAAGHAEAVRPCVACNRCAESVTQGPLRCLVNPEAGRPPEETQPARTPKDVLVVGGGPAGLSAAIEAAARGHRVQLIEAGPRLGGKAWASALPPEKGAFAEFAAYLAARAETAGIGVTLDRTLSVEDALGSSADVIVWAVGATPLPPPPVPGLAEHPQVLHPEAALTGELPRGRILILGGGPEGCEVADALSHGVDGREVHLVERRPKIGLGMPSSVRGLLQQRLVDAGVHLHTGRTVAEVGPAQVRLADRRDRPAEVLPPMDAIVLCIGVAPRPVDARLMADPRVRLLGDARQAATLLEAVAEGHRLGREV